MHAIMTSMEQSGPIDPMAIRKAMPTAIAAMPDNFNPYEVKVIDDKRGFVTPTTVAVVKDGKIVVECMSE